MDEALKKLKMDLREIREEIIIHTQFRRNCAVSPNDPMWGKPNPIDINGLITMAFHAGSRARKKQQEEA